MTAVSASLKSSSQGWQLILADLALILFLLTLSALPAAEAESGHKLADRAARGEGSAPAHRHCRNRRCAGAVSTRRRRADAGGMAGGPAARPPGDAHRFFARHPAR